MSPSGTTPPLLDAVRRLATRQGGPVGLDQMRALGMSTDLIRSWVRTGRLVRLQRRVYALGDRTLSERGQLMVPVLACAPDAVLSHRTAGALWKLRPWRSPIVEVTVPRQSCPRPPRTIVHRTRHLPAGQIVRLDGLPVTTVTRTLLDLADVLERRALERTLDEAHYLRLLDLPALDAAVQNAPGRRGATKLKHALESHRPGSTRTRSELEEAFLALCEAYGLPRPEVNAGREAYLVDFTWPESDLVVETDGRAAHGTPAAFERDHARDVELTLADRPVLRFTYKQITEQPAWVAEKVREGYNRSRKSNASSPGSADGRSKKSGLRQSKASP